jgi:hypothetical protein
VAQLYPQAPSTHFSRLLRHAWATVGHFVSPVTTRERRLHNFHEIYFMPVQVSNMMKFISAKSKRITIPGTLNFVKIFLISVSQYDMFAPERKQYEGFIVLVFI